MMDNNNSQVKKNMCVKEKWSKIEIARLCFVPLSIVIILGIYLYTTKKGASRIVEPIEILKIVDGQEAYNEMIIDKDKQPVGFNIGTFEDIGSFDPIAQKDFSGGISYTIYPSKDLSTIIMITIPETRCSLPFLFSSETNKRRDENPFSVGYKEGTGYKNYGPVLYYRGIHWKKFGTRPEEHITTDWDPVCDFMNVYLTPEAKQKSEELLHMLRDLKDLKYTENGFEKANGIILTDEELDDAVKYGIIETKRIFLFFDEPVGISKEYKIVQNYINGKVK